MSSAGAWGASDLLKTKRRIWSDSPSLLPDSPRKKVRAKRNDGRIRTDGENDWVGGEVQSCRARRREGEAAGTVTMEARRRPQRNSAVPYLITSYLLPCPALGA